MAQAMIKRVLVSLMALLCLATTGYVLFFYVGDENRQENVSSTPDNPTKSSAYRSHGIYAVVPPPSLKKSPMSDFVPQREKPQPTRGKPVEITHVMVPRPLQLDLPPALENDEASGSVSAASQAASTPVDNLKLPSSVNLNPNIDDDQNVTDDQKLFNNYTGLRGFMAQNWLNDRVGLQGGLAIPKQELRNDQESLRDQMAVGMGVLFAF